MLHIDEDITQASTLPSEFYTDKKYFEWSKEKIFARTWHLAASLEEVKTPGQTFPFTLLPGSLDEPLLLTRDNDDQLHCISNVCTHRGNIVCERGGIEKNLRCRYHGRRFSLDGKFTGMPEFEEVKNFPSEKDNLAPVPFETWGGFAFASLFPAFSFGEAFGDMISRIPWLDPSDYRFSSHHSKDYLVNANWALYCENYLEGFHIPFVHASLNQVLDYGSYAYEIYQYSNLQIGYARAGEDTFKIPPSSPDFGKHIAAYYYWMFPNIMFNFYPWGLSVNVVKPLSVSQTKVSFLTYIADQEKFEHGVAAMTDRVEREDEAIVENVQRGVRSRLYDSGRYSPTKEKGTHHFHRLIARFMQ
ncbi:MAG TPA: aromatic ring-hydroxylating dioxygenase subunit alpha [Chitinophagales bacterium]|nr:aromatic ring-hydroxylating dioxygenase subunit alpha [Chitinophagales bacterium]